MNLKVHKGGNLLETKRDIIVEAVENRDDIENKLTSNKSRLFACDRKLMKTYVSMVGVESGMRLRVGSEKIKLIFFVSNNKRIIKNSSSVNRENNCIKLRFLLILRFSLSKVSLS